MSNLKKILSIDGGGIRGIIPGQIMVEIEKEFKIKVSDYFDLIAGTSTGGILACAYLLPSAIGSKKPKYTAEEVVGLYFERGDEIFDIPTFHKVKTLGGVLDEKYPEDGIEEALDDYFGDVWIKDLLKPALITSYDISRRKGHFFGSHKAAKDSEFNFKVKDAARATSAAPTFFECAQVFSETNKKYNLIDGGVFINNPALTAYAEGRSIFQVDGKDAIAKDMKILSISTGYTRHKYHYSKAKNYGMAQWVKPLIDIMMSGAAEVVDYQMAKMYGTTPNPKQYMRIDGDLKTTEIEEAMDCATKQNMKKLKAFGTQLFEENKKEIKEWLEM